MQLLKNSGVYLISSVINKLLPFLLLPVLTRYLDPTEYGVLSVFQILISAYLAFIGMGIHANITKNYSSYSRQGLSLLLANILIVLIASTLVTQAVTFLMTLGEATFFSVPVSWVRLLPLICFLSMVNLCYLTLLRNQGKAVAYGKVEVGSSVFNVVFSLFFLMVIGLGWESRALGILLANALVFIFVVYMLRKDWLSAITWDKEEMKRILKLSLPLIPHVIGSIVISLSDRFFIEKMIGIEEVGIYSVGYMFGMTLMLFSDSFLKAWSPWFFRNIVPGEDQGKEKIVRFTYYYLGFVVLLLVGLTLMGNLMLPYVVGEEFYGADKYIFWICLGYAFFAVYQIFFPYLVHLNKTAFLALSTTLSAIINLVLNYFLIDYFGAMGAAYATVIAFAVSAFLVFWFQYRRIQMPWIKGFKLIFKQ